MTFWGHSPTTTQYFESAESQSLSRYTGDTGSFSFVTSPVSQGTYALQSPSTSGGVSIRASTGEDKTPSRGDVFALDVHIASGDERSYFYFFDDGAGAHYYVIFGANADEIIFRVDDGTTNTKLDEAASVGWTAGEYHTFEIDTSDTATDTITITMKDTGGATLATLSASDATRDTGGYILGHNGVSASAQTTFDNGVFL